MHKTEIPQLLIVIGKGGVGKSTVSFALGMAAAARGLRTIVVETNSCTSIPRMARRESLGYAPLEIEKNLHVLSVSPREAIQEYVVQQLKFQRLYRLIFENRFMLPLLQGAPGLHDAVQIGKVYDLVRSGEWDLVIVDSPATGHGLSMLNAPKTMKELTRVGPIYQSNLEVDEVLGDPTRCGLVLVTLLEDLPTTETLGLWGQLSPDRRSQCRICIQNQVLQPPLQQSDWSTLKAENPPDADLESLYSYTDLLLEKHAQQERLATKLSEELPIPTWRTPWLPASPDGSWQVQGESILQRIQSR
jgi:anion-transporting  ArsA/GET3 family ATPase